MTLDEAMSAIIQGKVPKTKSTWYEWSAIKAYLSENSYDALDIYNQLFETNVESDAPRWLIQLACEMQGAYLGHKRTGKRWEGLEAKSLAVVRQLSLTALNKAPIVRNHLGTISPELCMRHT